MSTEVAAQLLLAEIFMQDFQRREDGTPTKIWGKRFEDKKEKLPENVALCHSEGGVGDTSQLGWAADL